MELTLERALEITKKAVDKAKKMSVSSTIVVVDAGANIKAFARMDGAMLAATDIAIGKAKTSVGYGAPTEGLRQFIKGDEALSQVFTTLPNILPLGGGIPIMQGNQLLGAIGVSGGHWTQDVEVATAALG